MKLKILISSIIILVGISLFYNKISQTKDHFTPFANVSRPLLIAHAGGNLNGIKYLNSKEAVENAIKNGFTLIELDLLETTDNDIIAAHDWKKFHTITGFSDVETPISSTEAQKRKILKTQTVLTSDEINQIFTTHPNLYLVTDKIQNIDLVLNKFSNFSDRIIMEVFTVDKYKEAQKKGLLAAFCVWNSLPKFYRLVEKHNIKMITLSSANIAAHIKWHNQHKDVISLAFSGNEDNKANDIQSILKLYPHVQAWYTDDILPNEIPLQIDTNG